MTNASPSQPHGVSAESLLGQVADEFVERLDRGERVGIEEYAERYPQIASEIRQVLPALAVMQPADENAEPIYDGSAQETQIPGTLGDFRIIREIGRGGMGIVYEAEQVSIGRRVALKVLPFAAMLDPKQLQRFKNEVHATGQLHHTNSTEHSTRNREFFRNVAQLGIQAAEALDHAHEVGIVHRDIKPSNLLLDVQGNLWITDFGLARFQSDQGLTMTGDLVGTLRYMSPEQETALANLHRQRAEGNFGKALSGMSGLLEELNVRRWPHIPEITTVRRAMQSQMTEFFAGFMDENSTDPITRMETGWAYQSMGMIYLRQDDHTRAEPALRNALDIHENLAADYPGDPGHIKMLAQSLDRLGFFLYSTGRCQEARNLFERAGEQYRIQLGMQPDWVAYNDLAWFLVTCPDVDMHNPGEAIELASRGVELEPQSVHSMESLGIAHFRNGNWGAAVSNLEECVRLSSKDNPCFSFFLAMAHHKLGNHDSAHHYYGRGVEWMKQRNPERSGFRVRQFQTEAAELLGIDVDATQWEEN